MFATYEGRRGEGVPVKANRSDPCDRTVLSSPMDARLSSGWMNLDILIVKLCYDFSRCDHWGNRREGSGPQPFGHQGPISWKTNFSWTRRGGIWFWDDSGTSHLLCTLFLLLLYQPHPRLSNMRSWWLGTPGIEYTGSLCNISCNCM